jgi:hypothetical protein
VKVTIEMTLSAETAQRFKEAAKRLAVMDIGDDGMLAALVLERIAADYERAVEAMRSGDQETHTPPPIPPG